MKRALSLFVVVAALSGILAGVWMWVDPTKYEVNLVMPAATNIVNGGDVQVRGISAGKVDGIRVQDGKAVVTVNLDKEFAPLHDGTTAQVEWKAVLGERIIQLTPGPLKNPEVPNGGMIQAGMQQPVELDQVLAALDPKTRQRLNSLVHQLQGTTGGSEPDLNATLRTAGPAVQSLGEVLKGIGTDGPAIRSLVTELSQMTGTLAQRQSDLRSIVENLSQTTNATANQRDQLRQSLHQLPGTLKSADSALTNVPGAVDQSMPLLHDLRPATKKLPSVAGNLNPLLTDLRPTVARLKPTLQSAQGLLGRTPGFLDSAHAVLPEAKSTLDSAAPAISFLRPYTPELAGWLSNWGSAAANYDSFGNYARIYIQGGAGNVNSNPGVMPPGVQDKQTRVPGELEHQPWTDAAGSGMR